LALGLPQLWLSDVAWGDYDGDGDLDLALSGQDDASVRVSAIYRNDGAGGFTDIAAGLAPTSNTALAWGDYDADGDLDLLQAGFTPGPGPNSRIYRNDGSGVFTDIGAGLPGLDDGAADWGDYDNDGDLDLALTGAGPGLLETSHIYRNDGAGTFTNINAGLQPLRASSVDWGDYDNDGDLDLLIAGIDDANVDHSILYRNEGNGIFTDINAGLADVRGCSVAWGDYDADGDLDLALTGWTGSARISLIYRNDGGVFVDIGAGLMNVSGSSLAWGDFDNDGDLDLALCGGGLGTFTRIYRNDGADTFTELDLGLEGVWLGALAWGDFDQDGDLDLSLTGTLSSATAVSRLYVNNAPVRNAAPAAPFNLSASKAGTGPYDVTIQWQTLGDNPASDGVGMTPDGGLSYNLRVGTTPGGFDIHAGMAASSGLRRLPARGIAQPGASVHQWTFRMPAGTYYYSVQAIDAGLRGSPWAAERVIPVP
jgi:hypothetical protein